MHFEAFLERIDRMNTICSKCGKYPAVVYITKMEGNKTTNEGLCLKCARELGIEPINRMVNNMMDKFGIEENDFIAAAGHASCL